MTVDDSRREGKRSRLDWSWLGSVALAAIGLLDSIYLTWIKLADQVASCGGIGDCEAVNASRYAEIAGVPIALFGAAAYLLVLVLLFVERREGTVGEAARFAIFGVTLAGTIYSAYLTYLEIFILKAICPFCVVSALAMLGLFVLSLVRLDLWGRLPEEG
ncbi:MAG TPA: vitamin K epoxide reductase family protein [Anaerolineales bacterium]|nr:vitamin K epoxide reductase family protein [Anaerolineales bacterium]